MRHRFFVPQIEDTVTLTGDELHHATRVVRVREGEEVELFDGRGTIAIARAAANGTLSVIEKIASRESPLAIDLAMSIIALDKFELVLQKATELGARSIIPIVSERVEVRAERYRGKHERWEKIVFEAVKQCGRGIIPKVEPPAAFEEALQRDGMKILFDADREPSSHPAPPGAVTLFIGPEGGWSENELVLAASHDCTFARMGPRRLRAETAAIAALSIVAARWGDLELS
jgi:16S rRNA (uracil1498-N3)-methyltransferase